jgi:hypothetical protein
MGLPKTNITKLDGNTGVVKPSTSGVLAIIAPAEKGTTDQAGTYTRIADAIAKFGLGALNELGSYFMANAKKPVLLIRAAASTAAAYSAIDDDGVTGTSAVTASATAPLDDYQDVTFKVIHGGTIGVTGITYQYSLGPGHLSPVTALGTATSAAFNAPVTNTPSGVSLDFAAGTLVAGDVVTFSTTGPRMTNSDLVEALEALRLTKLPWDAVLVGNCDAASTTIATLNQWLTDLEGRGVFKMGYMNTRHKTPAESEAAFATAMATVRSAASPTIRIDVGTDGGDVASGITGLLQVRPTALAVSTRALSGTIGTDPAFVGSGSIPNFAIYDSAGNPKWHDENLFPGLDDLTFTTLRTIDGEDGIFITNANLFSGAGSDFVYDQHARTMNAACTIVYGILTRELGRGVRKQEADPITGAVYILDDDATAIEELANAAERRALEKEVDAVQVALSRTDDLSSNGPNKLTASVELEAFAYIKEFDVGAKFVRSISVNLGGA